MHYIKRFLFHPIKRCVAKYYLIFLKQLFGIKVIAITGSAGKTTTKEMLLSILQQDAKTIASYANIDPVYNIPSTILKCKPSTKYLILEMGIEYPKEMDFYLWLAKPDIGVITNIYPTHTLFLNDVEGVAFEKGKLITSLNKDDFAVVNSEDAHIKKICRKVKAKLIWFGKNTSIRYKNYKITKDFKSRFRLLICDQEVDVKLPIIGEQFVKDALAAASVSSALEIPLTKIKKGLELYSAPEHRMKIIKHKSGSIIIDDTYNNNPQAAREALITLKSLAKGKKIGIVFGDMLELGKDEKKFHKEIGNEISKLNPKFVISVGSASRNLTKNSIWFAKGQNKEISFALKKLIKRNYVVLIKGSRSIGLDDIIKQL
jgi:UDP-N-acetylmuramoyl-tripeptide--D-alanyl-D-alanine ligase